MGMGVRSAMGLEWELSAWDGDKTWELSPATVNSLLFLGGGLHSDME